MSTVLGKTWRISLIVCLVLFIILYCVEQYKYPESLKDIQTAINIDKTTLMALWVVDKFTNLEAAALTDESSVLNYYLKRYNSKSTVDRTDADKLAYEINENINKYKEYAVYHDTVLWPKRICFLSGSLFALTGTISFIINVFK